MYEAVGAVLCSRVWCVFLFLRCGVVALVGVYGARRVICIQGCIVMYAAARLM